MPLRLFEPDSSRNPLMLEPDRLLRAFDESGVLLLRGYDFNLPVFEAFTQRLSGRFHTPATRADRKRDGDGHSTDVIASNHTLLAHAEGAYTPVGAPPDICFFCCLVPPAVPGGETTITDGAAFFGRMPRQLRDRFAGGITYEMLWEEKRWQDEFGITGTGELETALSGMKNVRYTLRGTSLNLFHATHAITTAHDGSQVFANGLLAHLPHITHPRYKDRKTHAKPTNRVAFADGEAIPDDVINALIDINDATLHAHRWQQGDLLILDNSRYMHGRTRTETDCERVLLSRFGWRKAA